MHSLAKSSIALAALVITACNMVAPKQPDAGGDDSLLASIGGMSNTDTANTNLYYQLVCDQGSFSIRGALGPDQKSVKFPGAQIVDGKTKCALEVRMDLAKATQLTNYVWYGKKSDQTPDVGLFYGSDAELVQNRQLNLKLYVLYKDNTPPAVDTFDIVAHIAIDAANAPALTGSTYQARLTCGTQQIVTDSSQIKAGPSAETYDITFPKNVLSTFKALTCTHIGIGGGAQYSADYSGYSEIYGADYPSGGVPLAGAVASKAFDLYSTAGGSARLVLEPATSGGTGTSTGTGTGTDVTVTTQPATCLNYSSSTNTCLDRTSQPLSLTQNFVLAEVQGRKNAGTGDPVSFLVAYGPGLGLLPKDVLLVDDLNAALAAGAAVTATPAPAPADYTAAPAGYSWYVDSSDAKGGLVALNFDANAVSGQSINPAWRAQASDLAGIKILHIAQVWIHGFHPVDQPTLDAEAQASWMVLVQASQPGQATKQFIVTSKPKYFLPAGPEATANGAPTYFDLPTLAADYTQAGGSTRYQVYALAGNAVVTGCQADLGALTLDVSSKSLSDLTTPDPALDACAYADGTFNTALLSAPWSDAPAYFAWEWFTLIKQ